MPTRTVNSECLCGCGNVTCYVVHDEPTKYAKLGSGYRESPSTLQPTPRGTTQGDLPKGNTKGTPQFKRIDVNADAANTSLPVRHQPTGASKTITGSKDDDTDEVRKAAGEIMVEMGGRLEWQHCLELARNLVRSEREKSSMSRTRSTSQQPTRYSAQQAQADVARLERDIDNALTGVDRRQLAEQYSRSHGQQRTQNEAYAKVLRQIDQAARNGAVFSTKGMLADEVARMESLKYGRRKVTDQDVRQYCEAEINKGRHVSFAEGRAELCGA